MRGERETDESESARAIEREENRHAGRGARTACSERRRGMPLACECQRLTKRL
jgi:hypothetical protein